MGLRGDAVGDTKLLQGAALLSAHRRAGDRKHRGVFQGPEKTDLPASACAVSRLALQDHAELLEEEHKGTTVLPGNTPSPAGNAALSRGSV